ncbi:MAG: vanadium-dependent haloperoxidase, partial [Chloroflexota bacterium]
VDSARLFAAVHTSVADALISIWWAKVHYGFWRPITAINLADTDGNPATTRDTAWTPLLTTPPYPDYISGYSGVTGAVSRSLELVLGTDAIDLDLTSTAVAGATRHYDAPGSLNDDVVNARIWLGIHFRFADTAGLKVGQHAANWVLGHAFQPIGG